MVASAKAESDTTRSEPEDATPGLGPLKHIAYYSSECSGGIRYDLSCLRTFREPKVPANLSEGRYECVERNRSNTTLGHPVPLDAVVGACLQFGVSAAIRQAHVVTWRGVITKLMTSKDTLQLLVSYIDGVLYLLEFDSAPRIIHVAQIESGYHGYAFESLCTAANPDDAINVDLDVWKCVATRSLGDLNLVYGGEVDCIRGKYIGDSSNFIELKTKKEHKWNKNARKWFVQSHLMGVPEILVGYRDDANVLTRTRLFPTDHFGPKASDWLTSGYKAAHSVLHTLRDLCSSHIFEHNADPNDAIWRVTVRQGHIQAFHLLNKKEVTDLRARATGERLGLLSVEHVAQLRARAMQSRRQSG